MRLPRKPALIHREILCVAYDDRSLYDVLQFADITRPRVRLQQFQALFVYPTNVLSHFPGVTIDDRAVTFDDTPAPLPDLPFQPISGQPFPPRTPPPQTPKTLFS